MVRSGNSSRLLPSVAATRRMSDVRAHLSNRTEGEEEEDSVASSPVASTGGASLERNAIGLTEVLFQSITHMAPAVATALSIGLATTLAGGITPLAVVFALIACLFTAYSMSQLARHMSSAGGMYTYVTRGLGSFVGWLMAWAFTLAEPIVPAALFGAFGFFGASFITELTGFSSEWLWLVLAVICGLDRVVAHLSRDRRSPPGPASSSG